MATATASTELAGIMSSLASLQSVSLDLARREPVRRVVGAGVTILTAFGFAAAEAKWPAKMQAAEVPFSALFGAVGLASGIVLGLMGKDENQRALFGLAADGAMAFGTGAACAAGTTFARTAPAFQPAAAA